MSGARWKGKRLSPAMGHQFEDSLECKWCKIHWVQQMRDPQKCIRHMIKTELKSKFTKRNGELQAEG